MTDAWPPLPETIRTPRLLLRPIKLTDIDDVFAYARDPEWSRFLPIEQPYERRLAEQFVARQALADWDESPEWGIEYEGRVVGTVALRPDRKHRRAGIGYALARWLWGQGIMTEAAGAIVDQAFQQLAIERLDSFAIAGNVGSTRVMEKLGMQREGVLRRRRMQRGELYDEVHYSILRDEWEGSR